VKSDQGIEATVPFVPYTGTVDPRLTGLSAEGEFHSLIGVFTLAKPTYGIRLMEVLTLPKNTLCIVRMWGQILLPVIPG
jgi:hypothetical protein